MRSDADHIHHRYRASDNASYQALIDFNGSDFLQMRLPVRLIIFFGAPHQGLEITALQRIVRSEPSKDLIQELKPESPTLTDLNDRFIHVAKDISILSLYELVKTPTVVKVHLSYLLRVALLILCFRGRMASGSVMVRKS